MITAASSDFICNSSIYNYCYSNVQTCENYWPLFSNLTMVLETNEYTIQPEGYTLNNDLDNHACSIAVTSIPDSQGIVILGDTWLRNFVSTYDYKANKMRFAVNVYAPAGTTIVEHPAALTTDMLYLIGGGVAALIILYCLCKCCKSDKKKKKKKSKRETSLTESGSSDSD